MFFGFLSKLIILSNSGCWLLRRICFSIRWDIFIIVLLMLKAGKLCRTIIFHCYAIALIIELNSLKLFYWIPPALSLSLSSHLLYHPFLALPFHHLSFSFCITVYFVGRYVSCFFKEGCCGSDYLRLDFGWIKYGKYEIIEGM